MNTTKPPFVIGLLVTEQGFPLIHEVFKGNTFEGHTMLSVVNTFQQQYNTVKPIIVADSAMLSQKNRDALDSEGYLYIVGARLANTKLSFLSSINDKLPKNDGATIRLSYPGTNFDIVCAYSHTRYKKDLLCCVYDRQIY